MRNLMLLFALILVMFLIPDADADAGPLARFRQRQATPAPQAVPQKAAPTAARQAAPQPKVVEGIGDGEIIQRIMLRRVREHAVDRAVKNGVQVPGGGVRKITREEAEKRVARIKDSDILDYAKVKGGPVGKLGDGTFLNWLWEHKEELIRFILSLLAIFGDDEPG